MNGGGEGPGGQDHYGKWEALPGDHLFRGLRGEERHRPCDGAGSLYQPRGPGEAAGSDYQKMPGPDPPGDDAIGGSP